MITKPPASYTHQKYHLSKLLSLSISASLGLFSLNAYPQGHPIAMDRANDISMGIRSSIDTADISNRIEVSKQFITRQAALNGPQLDTDLPSSNSNTDTTARIWVNEIKFTRLPEFPDNGITKESVLGLAEEQRSVYMKEHEVFASGYTRKDLEEIADFLSSINAQTRPEKFTLSHTKKLADLVRRQHVARGMSYADIQEVANTLTNYYRKNGLFLAKVDIPAQEVKNGVIYFSVREGILGNITVAENDSYSDEVIKSAFRDQLGNLVNYDDIEEAFYLLNDKPGLSVYGYFSAGANPGETKLNIRAREESMFNFTVRGDNFGSLYTGEHRLNTTMEVINPTGIGDSLFVGYRQSFSPDNSSFSQLAYSFPLWGDKTRFSLSAEKNDFNLQDEDDPENAINLLGIEGLSENYSADFDYKITRSRTTNINFGLGFTDKKTDLDAEVSLPNPPDHVRGSYLELYADIMGSNVRVFNILDARIQHGQFVNDVDENRGANFYKLGLNTNTLFFVPIPFTEHDSRFIINSRMQYSDSALPAFEQASLGGAGAVRAFTSSEFSADSSAFMSLEWYPNIFGNSDLSDMVQVAIFYEAAYGSINYYETNDITLNDDWAYLSGWGTSLKFSWKDQVSVNLNVAWPDTAKSSLDEVGDSADSSTTYIDFSIAF